MELHTYQNSHFRAAFNSTLVIVFFCRLLFSFPPKLAVFLCLIFSLIYNKKTLNVRFLADIVEFNIYLKADFLIKLAFFMPVSL